MIAQVAQRLGAPVRAWLAAADPPEAVAPAAAAVRNVSHGNNFNLVRLAAAWLVLFGHGFQFLGLPEPRFLSSWPLGVLGVYVFFAISGFLVTQSWQSDPHLLRFLARRALRIFPGLIVCVLGCALVLGPLVSSEPLAAYFSGGHVTHFLYNIVLYPVFYLPGVFADNRVAHAVNGSLWSLPLEFLCYVVLVATVWWVRRARTYLLVCGGWLVATFAWALPAEEMVVVYGSDLRQFFLCGSFFWVGSAIARLGWQRHLTLTWVVLALVGLMCLARYPELLALAARVLLPVAVIGFGLAVSPLISRLTQHHDYSYGIYIYAFPVQQTVVWLWPDMAVTPYMLLCTLITLALAVASWRWIEQPALRLKPGRRGSATTARG